MRILRFLPALFLFLPQLPVGAMEAQAQTAVVLRAGSPGIGLEVARDLHPRVSVRGGLGAIPGQAFDLTLEDDQVDMGFDVEAGLGTFHLMADFLPLGPRVRLSAGLIHNSLSLDALGTPLNAYEVGNRIFNPDELGSMRAEAEYGRRLAPYLGVGLGSLTTGRRVGVVLDAGVAFSGPLSVDLEATGMLSPSVNQEVVIQEALDGVRIFPALSLGLAVRL